MVANFGGGGLALIASDVAGGEAGEASGLTVGGDAKASLEGSVAFVSTVTSVAFRGTASVLLPSSAVIKGDSASAA
jgi:hypothetical protein